MPINTKQSQSSGVFCIICQAGNFINRMQFKIVGTQECYSIIECMQCGLEYTSPFPQTIENYYDSAYYGSRHGFTAWYCDHRRLQRVRKLTPKTARSLLDVGCGDATFLKRAKKIGWRVFGTELKSSAGNKEDILIVNDLHAITANSIDCVTLWHVLEHLTDPHAILNDINKKLSSAGILFIAVPNAKGWQAKIFGQHWLHRDVPRHLFHFGLLQLEKLLQQHGFTIIKQWQHELEYDLLGWSQSALNVLFKTPNLFFAILTKRQVKMNWAQRAIHFLLGCLFTALAIPFMLLSNLFGQGGTIVIAAKKANSS